MSGAPYGRIVLEHFRRPRNNGPLPNASAEAEAVNQLCGDRVRVAITVGSEGHCIDDARFTANACAICVASASLLTDRLRGMASIDVSALSDEDVIRMLESDIPAARRRCATLPLEAARRAMQRANESKLERRETTAGTLVGLVLAAGSSRRFGGPQKLLAEIPHHEGRRRCVVSLAAGSLLHAGLARVLVVVGRESGRVRECLADLDVEIVMNEQYNEGMSTSVRTGVRAALERWSDVSGILIALGDQPLTDGTIVPHLLEAFAMGADIVAPRYRAARGNPVVFRSTMAPELLAITGDQGARAIIERDPSRVQYVDFDHEAPIDVDRPSDLARLAERLGVIQ